MAAAQTLLKDSVAPNKPASPVDSKTEDRTLARGYRIEDLVDLARKDGLALDTLRL